MYQNSIVDALLFLLSQDVPAHELYYIKSAGDKRRGKV